MDWVSFNVRMRDTPVWVRVRVRVRVKVRD